MVVYEGSEPVVIPNSEGSRTTSGGIRQNGERSGADSQRQPSPTPTGQYPVSREMGSKLHKKVVTGKIYATGDIVYTQKLKTDAEAYLGQKITEAVITFGLLYRLETGHKGRR